VLKVSRRAEKPQGNRTRVRRGASSSRSNRAHIGGMARNMFSRTVKYGRERPHELAMPDGESSHDSRRKRQGRSSLTEIATFSTFRRCNQPRLASSLFPFFNLFFHYRAFLDFDRRKTRFPFSALILAYSSAFAFFLLARVRSCVFPTDQINIADNVTN